MQLNFQVAAAFNDYAPQQACVEAMVPPRCTAFLRPASINGLATLNSSAEVGASNISNPEPLPLNCKLQPLPNCRLRARIIIIIHIETSHTPVSNDMDEGVLQVVALLGTASMEPSKACHLLACRLRCEHSEALLRLLQAHTLCMVHIPLSLTSPLNTALII